MNDLVIMEVAEGVYELVDVILGFRDGEFFAAFEHLKHVLWLAERGTPLEHIYKSMYTFYSS